MQRGSIGLRSRKVAPLYCKKHGKASTETIARPRDDSPDFTRGDLSLEEQSPIEGGVGQPAPVANEFPERLGLLLHDVAGTVRQSAEMQADSNARLGCELRDCISQPRVKAGASLERFRNVEQDVSLWLSQFEQQGTLNAYRDEHKASALPLYLSGTALTYYSTLV
eukprot:gene6433-7165_t